MSHFNNMNQGPPQQPAGFNQQQNYGAPPSGRNPGQYGRPAANNYNDGVNAQSPPITGPPPIGTPTQHAQGVKQPIGAFGEGRGNHLQQGTYGTQAMNGPFSQGAPQPVSNQQQPTSTSQLGQNGFGSMQPSSAGAPQSGPPQSMPPQSGLPDQRQMGYGGQQNR